MSRRVVTWLAIWALGSACGVSAACSRQRSPRPLAQLPGAAPAPALVGSAARSPGQLPEDRAAAARSEAQWREHLAAEERERKMLYDRRRLKEHRQILAFFREARGRYDRAATRAALFELEREWPRLSAANRQQIAKLDRWGNSSNLLTEYAALSQSLASTYPEARRQALSGAKEALAAAQREADAHTKKIVDWLASVEELATEGDEARHGRDDGP